MNRAAMARLHEAAFPAGRGWSEGEIAALIAGPGGFAVSAEAGFAIGRAVAGEAELITLAVEAAARRQGAGRALLEAFETEAAARGAGAGFLEVAADNEAALGLYRAAGWQETGRRRRYYPSGVDAVTMRKRLGGGDG